jgi:hypothetical protein
MIMVVSVTAPIGRDAELITGVLQEFRNMESPSRK